MRCLPAVLFSLAISCQAHAADLVVSAAASLTNAFRELAPAFEAEHPGARVQLNFGASGALLQQIARGAPVDVFASADQQTMDQAQAQKLLAPAGRRNFASNTLVLIVPATARAIPNTLADLRQPAYQRIAIGTATSVPAGRYARAALERAGMWSTLEPRLIAAQSVRQALDYVARGEVDAGFVYASDAALMPERVRVAATVPTEAPILYPVAALAGSANPALAQRFAAFTTSPPAQALLARYGFGKP
jgi:molybdate transport system substrate-binding protein